MFRRRHPGIEVLLVHPGGPFFRNRDNGVWTVPKGEAEPQEDLLTRATIEFQEELGLAPPSKFIELGSIRQKGGKVVHAWACETDLQSPLALRSNTFAIEWPPRSGKVVEFPEIDQAEFFSIPVAKEKINSAQVIFLERLLKTIDLP